MTLRSIGVVLLVTALAGAGAYLFWASREPAAAGAANAAAKAEPKVPNQLRFAEGSPQLTAIRIEAAIEAPLPIAEPLNGKIAYDEDVTARITSPIAGRIVALRAAAGDSVKAGDTLVNIDAPDLAVAIADTRKAEADEARKKFAKERSQTLMDADVIPRKDFESAVADFDQAHAETLRARLRLKNLVPAGGPGEYGFSLRSPLSGMVAERKANPSMEVQPGMADPLFVVSNLHRLWVLVDLPERLLGRIAPGLPVSVSVEAYPGQSFRAAVTRIGQVVNPDTRRIQVRCDLANPDGLLKPEMYARVSLLTTEGLQAVRLPNNALVTEGLYSFVFVESTPRVFIKRKVELAVQDREYSYVRSGLAKGERVVVGGALLLQSEMASGT
jgi:cobalt-zinc-cadmium efflux system membrane fusion protein